MKPMRFLNAILFLACQHKVTLSTEHYSLYKKLFLDQDYNPELRPVKNVTQAVDVQLEYRITSVNDLDEKNEVLNSNGWLKIWWTDEFLNWNSSKFKNLDKINMPAKKVWVPDLVLLNSNEYLIQIFKEGSMVILFSNGTIVWLMPVNWKTECRINVSKFPFDSQTCQLVIGQYTSEKGEVSIRGYASGKLDQYFKTHGEWEVTNLSLETAMDKLDGYLLSRITVNVVLTRRPLYHIITYILPVVALSVLNLATFLVPVECGEKISLCVSVLLSYAVTSSLPSVADTVSMFGIYLFVMLIVKVISCFMAVVVQKMNGTKTDEYRTTAGTVTPDVDLSGKVTSTNKAAKINSYSFCLILSLTVVVTASFFSWMAIGPK